MDSTTFIVGRILKDIRVELSSEFDLNFSRQAFFSRAWARHRSPHKPGAHILLDKGNLRRSIRANISGNAITFSSSLPYSEIHNEGGEIAVTAKMKKYFWAQYYQTVGSFGRKKNGQLREDKKNEHLGSMAEFYRHMALMKVGSTVKIPRRQFIGTSPELEAKVTGIIEDIIDEYINTTIETTFKEK